MELLFEIEVPEKDISGLDFELESLINKVVMTSLNYEKFTTNVEVSVSIVNNETIKDLNYQYRNKDYVTDVLSFPLIDNFDMKFSEEQIIALGDIVISLDKAKEQAKEYGHSVEREVGFLVAHSMLHLLGYDHMVEDEEKIMFEKQEDILNTINLTR